MKARWWVLEVAGQIAGLKALVGHTGSRTLAAGTTCGSFVVVASTVCIRGSPRSCLAVVVNDCNSSVVEARIAGCTGV